jgi:HlyD family secretion protein
MRLTDKRIWLPLLILVVGLAAGIAFLRSGRNEAASYRFATIESGPIVSAVATSGTLNAVTTVQVGSQVSGQIRELLADFNSEVKAGQVIARIDPEIFEARVRQAEADLAVARANVGIQRAGVERARREVDNSAAALTAVRAQAEKARVAAANAGKTLERRQALFRKGAISESQADDVRATAEQAEAQLASAEAESRAAAAQVAAREAALKTAAAQVAHAVEQVGQREAALRQSTVDFDHTFIHSPVDGVVIERSVDVGQTVAASLQAPKLFTIAQDLRRMQVEVDVDEADIGRVAEGQPGVFTVDAFPGREFKGQVVQIRKAPKVVQNVVTYTVLVSADNPEKRLLPGMTANIQIVVEERQDALKAPNSALRFRPPGEEAKSAPTAPGAAPPPRPAGDPGQAEERLRQLTAALELTEAQQSQVRVLFAEAREKIVAMRRQGASPEEIRAESAAAREKSRSAIAGLLDAGQREKYARITANQEASASARGRVYVADEKGRPAPVDVALGISDGTFTEIRGGGVQAGQKVFIGINPVNQKAAPGRGGPRFGF